MTSITVNIDEQLKKQAQEKMQKEGLTLTLFISKAINSYLKGEIDIAIVSNIKKDTMISASFDITSEQGKKECLDDFKNLIQ